MFKDIPLSSIVRKGNTRSYFDEDSINELSESIKNQGVLQAILVRPVEEKYELVFGERRYRASIIAGKETIPAMVRELTDEDVLEIQITENLHRDNINPLDEAIAFKMMQDMKQYSVEEIAARVGKSPGFVKSRIVLNDLVEDAKQLLYNGMLPVTHATKIAALQPKKQKEALNKVMVYDGEKKAISHRPIQELNWWLKQNLIKQLDSAAFDITDDKLIEGVSSCVNCPKCTINVASLFPEDATNRGCLDPVCYSQKVLAHIQKRTEEITKKNKGQEPVKVSDVFYTHDDGVMNATRYQVRSKSEKCQMCKLGVISHSDKGQEGKEVWVCEHSVCPTYQTAADMAKVSPEQAKKDVIKGHADRLANEMTMEQIYDENLDPKMMTVAEYLAKWDKLSYNRKQHIVNHLKWECDLSDEIANLGTTSDMQIADDNEMFYQNFHGRDKEKHIIDREFQLQLMLEWRSGGMNKIQQEIVDQTLEPVLKALTKNNLKLAKKLAEYYDKPTSKGLKNINPESLIRLFRTPSALKTLAKRFAIEVPDEISETIELASYIISRA